MYHNIDNMRSLERKDVVLGTFAPDSHERKFHLTYLALRASPSIGHQDISGSKPWWEGFISAVESGTILDAGGPRAKWMLTRTCHEHSHAVRQQQSFLS